MVNVQGAISIAKRKRKSYLPTSPILVDCLGTVSLPNRNMFDKQLKQPQELLSPHMYAHWDQDGVINDVGTLF